MVWESFNWHQIFSLRASSPFGGYREKYTRERHARGDATFAASPLTRAFSRGSLRSPNIRACSQAIKFSKGILPDSAIHGINHYPADNAISFRNTHPLDSVLSGGERYPTFEQPEPGLNSQLSVICLYDCAYYCCLNILFLLIYSFTFFYSQWDGECY